jgi:5-deoxy-D-glucuronate isomerase
MAGEDREVVLVARGQQSYYLIGMADSPRSWHSHDGLAHEWKLAMQTGCIPFVRSI